MKIQKFKCVIKAGCLDYGLNSVTNNCCKDNKNIAIVLTRTRTSLQMISLCFSRMLGLSSLFYPEGTGQQLPYHFILGYVNMFELLYYGNTELIYPFSFASIVLCRVEFYLGSDYWSKVLPTIV